MANGDVPANLEKQVEDAKKHMEAHIRGWAMSCVAPSMTADEINFLVRSATEIQTLHMRKAAGLMADIPKAETPVEHPRQVPKHLH